MITVMTVEARAPRVCIIGAGPSGIAASKALHERGIAFECFEQRGRGGGLWAVAGGEVQASYPSLECNTSKRRTEFSDFPMPQAFPPYPHNTQMAAYFDAYVDRFGFRDRITFNTSVEHTGRTADGAWDVRLSTGETRRYDALVVANAGAHGFFRVEYDAALLARLSGPALATLSTAERYSLVDDAWASVVAGRLTGEAYARFVRGFSDEPDLAVWEIVLNGLGWLDRFVAKAPAIAV